MSFIQVLKPGLSKVTGSGGSENNDIVITATRTSGVAPLSVFFDATGSTIADTSFFAADGDAVNGSYMDATFYWNVDTTNVDPTIDHKYGSGFVFAAVFKEPGTYTVQLKVYDNTGFIGYKNITITVSAFSGTTYYVAADGHDTNNDGLSTTAPFLTPAKGLSMLGSNIKVLFKNGDTFNISTNPTVNAVTGPAIVGNYSDPADPSDAIPIIHITAQDTAWTTFNFTACSDIRIMDLEQSALGESSVSPRYPYGFSWDAYSRNMLKYRTVEHDNGGISISPAGRGSCIAECEFYNTTQTGFTSTQSDVNDHNALIGNYIHDKNTVDPENEEHIFRIQTGSYYYIAHNTSGPNVKVNYDAWTFRGDTEKIVFYHNDITGWTQAAWPQNRNSAEEYQHHIMFDSNIIKGQGTYALDRTQALALSSKDIVFRNNIFYNYNYGAIINNDTVVGYSRRIRAYNNSFIYPNGISNFNAIDIDYQCTDIFIKNNIMLDLGSDSRAFLTIRSGSSITNLTSDYNIMYGPSWSNPALFDGATLSTWQTNTSQDLHSAIQNPNFISTDPTNDNFGKPTSDLTGEKLEYNALDCWGNLRGMAHDAGAREA